MLPFILLFTYIIYDSSVLPHILPFSIDEDYMWGDPVQFSCVVTKGDLPLIIGWSFEGGQLSDHLGIDITKLGPRSSLLSIQSLSVKHSGQYTCSARNTAGVTNYTTSVLVKGKTRDFELLLLGRSTLEV
uniref:Down syndrome cell adhesion molecule n=2 Tax=Cacopsylla melanoneura TaxID=428564 RepID=A0A8D8ZB17_9HEMI